MEGAYDESVFQAFHVENSTKVPKFNASSEAVSQALDYAFMNSTLELVNYLVG